MTLGDDPSAVGARARAEVDEPVRDRASWPRRARRRARCCPRSRRSAEAGEQAIGVARMKARRRLVEDESDADEARADLGREPDALQLAAGERVGRPFEASDSRGRRDRETRAASRSPSTSGGPTRSWGGSKRSESSAGRAASIVRADSSCSTSSAQPDRPRLGAEPRTAASRTDGVGPEDLDGGAAPSVFASTRRRSRAEITPANPSEGSPSRKAWRSFAWTRMPSGFERSSLRDLRKAASDGSAPTTALAAGLRPSHAATAPSSSDFDRSGITSSGSKTRSTPRPSQVGQAP